MTTLEVSMKDVLYHTRIVFYDDMNAYRPGPEAYKDIVAQEVRVDLLRGFSETISSKDIWFIQIVEEWIDPETYTGPYRKHFYFDVTGKGLILYAILRAGLYKKDEGI
jgi:hypothetical protein